MSKTLNLAAFKSFETFVKHAYQGQDNKLRPKVKQKLNVVGESHRFNKYGKGMAKKRTAPSVNVTPLNLPHSNQTVVLENWEAVEYTDIFDDSATDVSEQKALAFALTAAIVRRERQMIIDAADAAATANLVPAAHGTGTGLNYEKLTRAQRLLSELGVPQGDRIWVGSYEGQEQLLADNTITSSDFATAKVAATGMIEKFNNIDFCWVENAGEGGVPKAGTARTNFLIHGGMNGAVGFATGKGLDKKTSVDWIPEKKSWLSSVDLRAGATTIDAQGVVEIETTEAA